MFPIRDENPRRSFPFVTLLLALMNTAAFAYQILLGPANEAFVVRFGAIPWEIIHGAELPGLPESSLTGGPSGLTLLTSMFLHGGFMHLAGNMLYLWIFGDNVESLLGRFRFLLFYILCGLGAAMSYILVDPNSTVPMIGASGAISGVLGAYMIHFPKARVHVLVFMIWFIRVVRIPALVVLGFWFVFQLVNGLGALGTGQSGGVAWFAHVGGFVAGILLILIFPKRKSASSARIR
ncbi:rhomboid family intramembrane serine protease [bacterium]|nr:rhomboid family intramembrane serine protease [bacterium]